MRSSMSIALACAALLSLTSTAYAHLEQPDSWVRGDPPPRPVIPGAKYRWEPDYTSRTHYSSDGLRKTQICGYGQRSDSSCGGRFVAVPGADSPKEGTGQEPALSSRCIGNVPGQLNLIEAVNIEDFNAARFTFEVVSGNPDYPTAFVLSVAAHTGEGKGTKNVFCAPGTTAGQAWEWVNAYGGTWDLKNSRRFVMLDSNQKSWTYLPLWLSEVNNSSKYGAGRGRVYEILGDRVKFMSLNYYRPIGANQVGSIRPFMPYLWPPSGDEFCNRQNGEKKIRITSTTINTVNNVRRFTLRYEAAGKCTEWH